ncbi:MAG TPA: MBL fold metallo-hydrolase [Steroidobacteraceae bacterium]|jgi:beta-lactamase superfamily II metal-dependent hydrolase|nr:MBL fold metallo-hydrolase [Steroidobacteraceae bacterium]
MFKIHAVQARFGDCLLLEAGGSPRHFVLIDGGPPNTFADDLQPALKSIVGAGGKLDLVVLSHVDNDHVIGLLDMFADLQQAQTDGTTPLVRAHRLWHNSFQKTIDPNGEITQRLQTLTNVTGSAGVAMPMAVDAFLGIREGYRLRTLAVQLSLALNADFGDELITVEKAMHAIKIGSLSLRVVGPTAANLKELRGDWLAWLKKNEQKILQEPKTAANADQSVPNLSSIVLFAECANKTALLTGDARGDHIEQGLAAANLSQNGKLHVNLLKLQHHGSNRNITAAFLERITADTYLISADGTYGNPDFETLKWIVQAATKRHQQIEIVVTNSTPSTKKLLKQFAPAKHNYKLRVLVPNRHSIEIELA